MMDEYLCVSAARLIQGCFSSAFFFVFKESTSSSEDIKRIKGECWNLRGIRGDDFKSHQSSVESHPVSRIFPALFFRDLDKRAHVLWVSGGEATKTASRPSELLHSGSDDLR